MDSGRRKKKKITFIATSFDGTYEDGADFLLKLSDRLEKDFILSHVTVFKTIHKVFIKQGRECTHIPGELGKYGFKDLENELKKREKKYGITLESILVGDFDQYHHDRRRAQENMLRFFKFWEDYIDREKPDFIIGSGQRYVNLVAHAVCKKRKTKFLVLSITPFPETFLFTEDIRGRVSTLEKYWKKHSGKKLKADEKKKADKYINSIIKTKKRFFQADTTPRINLGKMNFFLGRAYRAFFTERLRTPYSKPWRGAYNYLLKIWRSKLSRSLYSKPDYTERYIFFPPHIEWDSVIIVWNPLFINQLYLINFLSRSLPSDVKLYVKEHPWDTGGTSIRQLKKIRDIPNVKLIDPRTDSHELIRNSEAVIVIAGTPGWEGLLMEKPVINVGATYYELTGLTWSVRDLSKLPETIRKALSTRKTDPVKHRETLYRFIAAFQKVTYPGRINFTQLYYSNVSNRDIVLSDENIGKVAAGIRKQLTKDYYLLE